MIPNVNPTTNLAYGVVDTKDFHWLAEDIFNNGTNLSEEQALDDIRTQFLNVVDDLPLTKSNGVVADALMDTLKDFLDGFEIEEPTHEYEADGTEYRMAYLGGAPLIWILESAWACPCRQCSPCVRNGGDLSNPTDLNDANCIAHCPIPDEWKAAYEESNDMEIPRFIYPVVDGEAKLDQPFDLWNHCGKTE